jgi:hypothetical protein
MIQFDVGQSIVSTKDLKGYARRRKADLIPFRDKPPGYCDG